MQTREDSRHMLL